jgi:hypothetical protein
MQVSKAGLTEVDTARAGILVMVVQDDTELGQAGIFAWDPGFDPTGEEDCTRLGSENEISGKCLGGEG